MSNECSVSAYGTRRALTAQDGESDRWWVTGLCRKSLAFSDTVGFRRSLRRVLCVTSENVLGLGFLAYKMRRVTFSNSVRG